MDPYQHKGKKQKEIKLIVKLETLGDCNIPSKQGKFLQQSLSHCGKKSNKTFPDQDRDPEQHRIRMVCC